MSVTSYRVTGRWKAVIPDTPADPDPYPDIVTVTGNVRFSPTVPGPVLHDGTAYTLGGVVGLVADGQLRDLQGREGVWLAGQIGDTSVEWDVTITVHYQGRTSTHTARFLLAGDHHLTGEVA